MRKFIRWTGSCLLLVGLALLVWLMNGNAQVDEKQQQMIDSFEAMQAASPSALETEPKQETNKQVQNNDGLQNIEGILSIESLDMKAPVRYGADAQTLSNSLGAIENMDAPGEMDGSYAIAGHQAYVFGKYFNRLHELEVGTAFTFQTLEKEMNFEVYDIQIVKPHEVDVLDPDPGIAKMSLITCYPEYSNELRLVVQAKLVK